MNVWVVDELVSKWYVEFTNTQLSQQVKAVIYYAMILEYYKRCPLSLQPATA